MNMIKASEALVQNMLGIGRRGAERDRRSVPQRHEGIHPLHGFRQFTATVSPCPGAHGRGLMTSSTGSTRSERHGLEKIKTIGIRIWRPRVSAALTDHAAWCAPRSTQR